MKRIKLRGTSKEAISAYFTEMGSLGGKATARSMTPEQRKASSDRANAAKRKKREQSNRSE